MAVQQRRVSKSRKGMRRSHDHLTISNTVACYKIQYLIRYTN